MPKFGAPAARITSSFYLSYSGPTPKIAGFDQIGSRPARRVSGGLRERKHAHYATDRRRRRHGHFVDLGLHEKTLLLAHHGVDSAVNARKTCCKIRSSNILAVYSLQHSTSPL